MPSRGTSRRRTSVAGTSVPSGAGKARVSHDVALRVVTRVRPAGAVSVRSPVRRSTSDQTRGMDVGLVDDGDAPSPRSPGCAIWSTVPASKSGSITKPAESRASSGSTRSRCRTSERKLSTTCVAKASTRSSRSLGFSGRTGSHDEVVLVGFAGDRAAGEPELLGVVVGHHEQGVRAVREDGVLGVVLHARAPPTHGARRVERTVGVDHPDLAGVPALRGEHEQTATPGRPDVELEPLVRLVEHQHVLVVRRPERVPPHLERPVGLVVHRVEEVRRVRAPGAAVVGAGHHVGQILAGLEVAEPQLVDLVARPIHRVGQQPFVRTDHVRPSSR